jgi:hypothetical protein
MPSDADRYQDLSRIREAIARAFNMTLPPATTINGQVEAIVQAIYDAAADRPRPASIDEKSTFKYRIDRWDAAGHNVLEHVAGLEDFAVAQAAYDRACRRWPKDRIALQQGARLIQESQHRQT